MGKQFSRNPEKYRGLDSHYWAIYHNDFDSLETCLHQIDQNLDTGKILFRTKIKLKKKINIHMIRYLNTEICIKLAKKFINIIKMKKNFKLNKQKVKGRYYSFMPSVLKLNLDKKLQKYLNANKIF